MKMLLTRQGVTALATSFLLTAAAAGAQPLLSNSDLIGNGDMYGPAQNIGPHLFTQPLIFGTGGSSSIELNGDFGIGGMYARQAMVNAYTGGIDGTLSATFRQTSPQGWTFGATASVTGEARYTLDAEDPLEIDLSTDGIEAYAFIDTPTFDVELGRYSPAMIETSGQATLPGTIDPTLADFSSAVGGRLAGSIGTRQGPWDARASADDENRQYAAVMWRRPVRTLTPAYSVEVIRDGNFDLADRPLTGGLASGEAQLYGGRIGGMIEYGRLTFGVSAGLEAFYDGRSLIEAQSIYDVGLSHKSGRYTYGIAVQHRRSHQENTFATSVTPDLTIAVATGIDLGLGYDFTRHDTDGPDVPAYSHTGKADVRVSF